MVSPTPFKVGPAPLKAAKGCAKLLVAYKSGLVFGSAPVKPIIACNPHRTLKNGLPGLVRDRLFAPRQAQNQRA